MAVYNRIRSSNFFLRFLITAAPAEIQSRLKELNVERGEIEQQVIDICYHFPSITWGTGWDLDAKQRERLIKYINKKQEEKAKAFGA